MALKEIVAKAAQIGKKALKGKAGKVLPKVALGVTLAKAGNRAIKEVVGGPLGDYMSKSYIDHINDGITHIQKGNTIKGMAKILFNHDDWYLNYPLDGLVSFNMGRRKGITESGISSDKAQPITNAVGMSVSLTIPKTDSASWEQANNIAYQSVRSANAGAINYTIHDLENYIISLRSLHAAYATLRRAYAILNNINLYDGTLPQSYFAAMGLDYATIRDNAANLKAYGNQLAIKMHSLCPLKIDLFERTRWMFSNGFADSDDAKATPYFFFASDVPYFDGSTMQLTALGTKGLSSSVTGMTYSTLIANVNNLIDAMTSNNVFAIIAGDILKAYGAASLYPVEIWDDNAATPIVYDEKILSQIQNASLAPGALSQSWSLTSQGYWTCALSCTPTIPSGVASQTAINMLFTPYADKQFVNGYKDSLTPAEVISITRFKMKGTNTWSSGNSFTFNATCFGTEVVEHATFIYYNSSSTNAFNLVSHDVYGITFNAIDMASNDMVIIPALTAQSDYFPQYSYVGYRNANHADVFRFPLVCDYNNYGILEGSQMGQFHDYAVLSLTAIPRKVRLSNAELIR